MYINVEILKESGIHINSLPYLILIGQNREEDLGGFLKINISQEFLNSMEEKGLVEYIKGTKNQTPFDKVRLSKKGKELLNNLGTVKVIGEDIAVFDYMAEIYKDAGKEIGNRKKTKTFIAEFRAKTGINRNKLVSLLTSFTEDANNFEYSQRLEYLFFKGANAFDTKFDPEQSRLFQYYLNREEYFNKVWEDPEYQR